MAKIDARTSAERIEDSAFENLIRKASRARDWAAVQLMSLTYGYVLEERERNR